MKLKESKETKLDGCGREYGSVGEVEGEHDQNTLDKIFRVREKEKNVEESYDCNNFSNTSH